MNDYDYSVHAIQVFSPRDPEVIAKRFLRTVDELSRIESLPSDEQGWGFCTSRTGWKIENDDIPFEMFSMTEARPKMADLVRASVARDDWLEPDPERGYILITSNQQLGSACTVCLTLGVGAAKPLNNNWRVSTGSYPTCADDSILTDPIFRSLFLTLISNWPCSWALVSGWKIKLRSVPGIVGTGFEHTFRHRINWFGYLSADESRGLQPPNELISERTPDGGLLMISTEHKPDPANAEDMRLSRILGEFMDAHRRDEWWPGGQRPARGFDNAPRSAP